MAGGRYTLPRGPIAHASVVIGRCGVEITLSLHGALDVDGPTTALTGVTDGLFISALGTATPVISSAARHRFVQHGRGLATPGTVSYDGIGHIDYVAGAVSVRGDVDYALRVTVDDRRQPAPRDLPAWIDHHGATLTSIGAVVLIARPLPPPR